MHWLRLVVDVYSHLFAFFYLTTVTLILLHKGWGQLPSKALKWLRRLLDALDDGVERLKKNNCSKAYVQKRFLTPDLIAKEKDVDPFSLSTTLLACGIESIIQDDVSRGFKAASKTGISLLEAPSGALILLYWVVAVFRWTFLLPLRAAFMATSVVFLALSSLLCIAFRAHRLQVRYCGITFARLFNVGTGLIVNSHDGQNRPRQPGLVVSNHISYNDVMTLYSDLPIDGRGYTVTAQSHGGFVRVLQKYGGLLTPLMLIDRANQTDRLSLRDSIRKKARLNDGCPVLLFPEGFCSNNDVVLQFRKAAFDDDIAIMPIAFRQDARFGDAFWREDTYLPYMLRLMTSLALVIDIYYLPPMRKLPQEGDTEFARRVQKAIAKAAGRDALPYDGGLKRPADRAKFRTKIQAAVRDAILNA